MAEPVDIEQLVAGLREEAARLRQSAGSGGSTVSSVLAPGSVESLLERTDTRRGDLRSHRGRLAGSVALTLKRALYRVIGPIFDRQVAFNEAAVRWLTDTGQNLDDQLEDLERRLRALEDDEAPAQTASDGAGEPSLGLDLTTLEETFRAPGERARAFARYAAALEDAPDGPVLDLSGARADFAPVLARTGRRVVALGSDPVEAAGVETVAGEPLEVLARWSPGTLAGVTAIRRVECLELHEVVTLVRDALEKLAPGGVLVLETMNVASLVTYTRAVALDPAAQRPWHPLTLRLLVEQVGFENVDLVYTGEVEEELRLEGAGDETPEARNAARMNAILFAPQDYAVVARRP